MANALLHVQAKVSTYELHELVTLFECYLSTEDSPTSIAPILHKHISLANKHPQTLPDGQSPGDVSGTEAQDTMDIGDKSDAECPSLHQAP